MESCIFSRESNLLDQLDTEGSRLPSWMGKTFGNKCKIGYRLYSYLFDTIKKKIEYYRLYYEEIVQAFNGVVEEDEIKHLGKCFTSRELKTVIARYWSSELDDIKKKIKYYGSLLESLHENKDNKLLSSDWLEYFIIDEHMLDIECVNGRLEIMNNKDYFNSISKGGKRKTKKKNKYKGKKEKKKTKKKNKYKGEKGKNKK